jgi:hypothetical protein
MDDKFDVIPPLDCRKATDLARSNPTDVPSLAQLEAHRELTEHASDCFTSSSEEQDRPTP